MCPLCEGFSWPNVCHSWTDLLGACMCGLCELCVAWCPPPDLWDYSNLCWLISLIRFISTRPQSSRMRCGGAGGEEGRPQRGGWCIIGAMNIYIFFFFALGWSHFLREGRSGSCLVVVMSVNVKWTCLPSLVIKQKLRETVIKMDYTDLMIYIFF